MELFVIIVSGFQPLTVITKCSVLDVVAALDPPLSEYGGRMKKVFFVYRCYYLEYF